jgi:hypothetical protein
MKINVFNEFNGCDELLQFMYECVREGFDPSSYSDYYFEGSRIKFTAGIPPIKGLFVISPKYPKTLFVIGEMDEEFDNTFELAILQGDSFMWDETIIVTLPGYVRNELIATAKGEW